MRKALIAVLAVLAGPAQAAPSVWSKLPDAKQMSAAYPQALSALRISGRAVLRCKVVAGNRLEGCAVAEEQPKALGFGLAAMQLVPLFVMKRPPADGEVSVPIRFEPAPDPLLVRGEGYKPPKASPDQQALARKAVAHAVPGEWMAAKVEAFVAQDLPATAGFGEDPEVLGQARAAVREAARANLPWMMEVTAVELAARLSPAKLQAALDAPPPADPGAFLDASFKGAPPKWALALALKVQADAKAGFCKANGC